MSRVGRNLAVGKGMRLFVVAMGMLMGCGYSPGSLRAHGPNGEAASLQRVGCLDIAVVPIIDSAANGPVAGYRFANRCDSPVPVDLRRVKVMAVFADGRRRELQPYDPNGHIRRGTLDGRASGAENLEYKLPVSLAPPSRLCVDISRINPAMSVAGPPVEVCIDAYVNRVPDTLARRGI